MPRARRSFAVIGAALFLWHATLPVALAAVPNYFIHTWQTENGLPQNSVTAVVQTHDGYLWLGTYNGLARFDGIQFTVFNDNNTPEFPNSRVTSLFESDDGTLWIGHATGEVTRYKNGQFYAENFRANWGGGKISDIAADESDDVWLMNEDGLLARVRDGLVLTPESGVASKLAEMTRSPTGKIWVARNGRVSVLNHGELTPLSFAEGATNNFVMGIGASREGGLWIICDGQLRRWNDNTWNREFGPSPSGTAPVHKLMESKKGFLAMGTSDRGFFLYFPESQTTYQFNRTNGFPSDWVISLTEDREGELWVGTGGGGLAVVREGIFQTIEPPDQWQGRAVLSVCAAPSGALWIGTEGAGLYRFEAGSWKNFSGNAGIRNPYVWSVAEDTQGNLWAGTWGAGLFLRRDDQFVSAPGLEEITLPMPAILCSTNGDLWIGTASGLLRYESGKPTWIGTNGGTGSWPDVRAIVEDDEGGVWFGMSGNGLGLLKNGEVHQFKKTEGLSSDFIECLHRDRDGALWIGTFGGGLNRLKHGRFSTINKNEGLPNSVICHIEEDGHGFFWMSSHGGIIRVSKAELDRCADGQVNTIHCLNYGMNDGLPTLECSGGLQPAGCKTSDGRLWFPTSKGLVATLPQNVKTNERPPPVVIEAPLVDGQIITSKKENGKNSSATTTATSLSPAPQTLEISPGQHRIEFQYTGLSFIAPEKVRFKYRLENSETEWTDAGSKRSVTYNYIPPGHYTFHVTACNNDNVWNETGASISIVMLPFFWQTMWFRILTGATVIIISGGLAWVGTRRRMRQKLERLERQRAVEHERARIAHDIHDDLGSHLTRITMLSESARGELDSPAGATADLNQIYDTARELTRAMDEIVWAVNPKHDTLESLASYLEKFAQDFLGAVSIRCRLDMPVQFPNWSLSAEVRHNVFLAFKESVNNAVKHAAASEVRVSLMLKANAFELTVEDNGHGFNLQKPASVPASSRNGLENMARRLREIGGQCDIRSEPGKGTRVIFLVPINVKQRNV